MDDIQPELAHKLDRCIAHCCAANPEAAALRLDDAGQDASKGSLARAVLTDQNMDSGFMKGQRCRMQRLNIAISDGDIFTAQDDLVASRRCHPAPFFLGCPLRLRSRRW